MTTAALPDAPVAPITPSFEAPTVTPPALPPISRTSDRLESVARFVLTVAISVGVAYAGMAQRVSRLEAELEARPPLIVVDFTKMATVLKGQPSDVIETAMGRVRGDIRKAQEDGYVVLDGQAVMAAPDSAMMMPVLSKAPAVPTPPPGQETKG